MRCILVCGGEFAAEKFCIQKGDVLVTADSGYAYVKDCVHVDYAVGDFDSLGYVPEGVEVIRHNPVKDYTDTQLAMEFAAEKGADEFVIYGALGGRLDHTLANIQTGYSFAKRGIKVTFKGKDCTAFYIMDRAVLRGEKGRFFSLFALDDAEGVTIKGAQYNLDGAKIVDDYPLGVSNAFTDGDCIVEVKKGILFAIVNDSGIV